MAADKAEVIQAAADAIDEKSFSLPWIARLLDLNSSEASYSAFTNFACFRFQGYQVHMQCSEHLPCAVVELTSKMSSFSSVSVASGLKLHEHYLLRAFAR